MVVDSESPSLQSCGDEIMINDDAKCSCFLKRMVFNAVKLLTKEKIKHYAEKGIQEKNTSFFFFCSFFIFVLGLIYGYYSK
ncbi:unnamed protein product [Prunus brigantina]